MRDAEKLISSLADHNMVMGLPHCFPTVQSMSTKNWTGVDNVFCTDNVQDSVTLCNTTPHLHGPRTNHVPVLTVLVIETAKKKGEPFHNF